MKTNNELIRELLKKAELIPNGESISITKLEEEMPEYADDILAMITLLNREHFIMIVDRPGYNDAEIFRENKLKGLTERGYRCLDVIREDEVWNLMKEKLINFNDLSFFIITHIASRIVEDKHNKLFNLNSDTVIDFTRW